MTRRTYSREDVQTHYGSDRPAVNVKVRTTLHDLKFPLPEADPELTLEWIEEHVSDAHLDELFWLVCSWEWEQIVQDARDILGEHVEVEQDGRSGGWAVVTGLPDIEEWDAVQLAKWRKFERYARGIANGIPEQMVYSIHSNEWEQARSAEIEEAGLHREVMPAA